jgi:hypothetical protein
MKNYNFISNVAKGEDLEKHKKRFENEIKRRGYRLAGEVKIKEIPHARGCINGFYQLSVEGIKNT